MPTSNLTTEQKVNLTLAPQTAAGNPATITGIPLWSSSNVNVLSLLVAADGLSAYAVATGAGTATISAIANAGTTANVVQITGYVLLTVTQAPAATLVISEGTPVSQ